MINLRPFDPASLACSETAWSLLLVFCGDARSRKGSFFAKPTIYKNKYSMFCDYEAHAFPPSLLLPSPRKRSTRRLRRTTPAGWRASPGPSALPTTQNGPRFGLLFSVAMGLLWEVAGVRQFNKGSQCRVFFWVWAAFLGKKKT